MLLDRVIDRQLALVREDHDADGGYRLGHRRNPEQGILRHRLAGLRVEVADRLVGHDGVLAADDRDRAGEVLVVHEFLHPGADIAELGVVGARRCQKGERGEGGDRDVNRHFG